jgi:UDP-N-acetylmuramyl pentapeptide phosphotransferase/UDP-N-acetylglucosamine-1-phosphate transferase
MIISLIIFVGMANAFNMIDGVNGLSSGNGIVILISMMLFNEINNINYDKVFFIIIISSLTGFWIINVINGKLFLGDGGAYFIGFLIAYLGLEQYKNNFDFVKLCIFFSYPTLEIFTTCMFRLIKKQKLLFPDKNHLHSILYEKLISLDKIPVKVVNSLSGIILVVFSFIPMLLICYISNSIVSIVLILMMLSIFIYFKFKGQFLYAND